MKTLVKSAVIAALALTVMGCKMESKPAHEKKQNGTEQGSPRSSMERDAQGMQKESTKPSSEY